MTIRLVPAVLAAACVSAGAHAANLNHHYDFGTGVVDLAGTINGTLFGNANVKNIFWMIFGKHIKPSATRHCGGNC